MKSLNAEPVEQMIADPERVGDDRQGRVYRRARREKAGVHDIEIVDLVGPAIDVESRAVRVAAKADCAVLMAGPGNRQTLSEIGVLRQQMRLAADVVEQVTELLRQPFVRLEVVRRVVEPNAAVAVDQDAVLGA